MAKNRKTFAGSKKFVATLPYLVAPSDETIDRMEFNFHLNQELESRFRIFDFEDFYDEGRFLDWMCEISVWQYDQMYICSPLKDIRSLLKVNPYESWLYTMYEFPLNQEDGDINWLANHPVYGKYFFLDHGKYRVFNFPHMNWFDAEALPDDDLSDIFSQMAEDVPAES